MPINTLPEAGKLTHVLVATDGSDGSAGAIRTGVALARTYGAQLTGLSIALDNPEYSTFVPNLQEMAQQHAREALKTFVEEAGEDAGTTIRDATDPATAIIEAASELKSDIIVLGRRGKRGLARMMVGDATAKVVGQAECPVLVVPRAAHLWEKHILLATDGSEYSDAAIDAAGRVARQARLPVKVVSVVTSSHSEERRQEAKRAVAVALERLKGLGVEAECQVEEGRPDDAIIKAAEAAGADLIIIGSHGRAGLRKILLGSVAERVIGHAPCSVLIIKP